MHLVDLHLHLLPGVDDGAPDEATALEHAAAMVAAGVREATVTPHIAHPFFPDMDALTVPARTAALQRALDRAGVRLRLHPSGELHPHGCVDLSARVLHAVAAGPAGARWVLVEVPFAGIDDGFGAALRTLRGHGFGAVIAHPERAAGVLADGLAILRREVLAGAVLQVNVCSLLGRHGDEAREAAERFVRSRLAYILASDGHPGTRTHTLAAGTAAAIAAGASPVPAWQLTQANPRFLLRHGLPRAAAPSEHAWRSVRDSVDHARRAARHTRRARR